MKFLILPFTLRLLAFLPLPLSRCLGRLCGRLVWLRQGTTAKVTRANIELCFPDLEFKAQLELTRRSIQETARMALETPAVWYHDNDWRTDKVVRWERAELFDSALKMKTGLIVLIPHLGNWEMAGMVASARRPSTIIYREPRVAQLNELLRELRDVGTTNLVPASGRGVMAVLKTLKEGGMTIILPDQEPATQGGVFSPFFGVSAFTMTLIHRLQSKTEARILFACARPERSGFTMCFYEPDEQIYSASEQESVDAMNATIESMVRESPEHYQWEYKRFRKRPDGEAKLYRFP